MFGNYGYYQPYQQNNPYQGYGVQQMAQQPQQSGSMIWVQGEAGAKSYLVAPGTTVTLWDSESPTIYLKSSDQSGMPSMRILDWTERNFSPNNAQKINRGGGGGSTIPQDYVKRAEFDDLKAKLEKILQNSQIRESERGDRNNGKSNISDDEPVTE